MNMDKMVVCSIDVLNMGRVVAMVRTVNKILVIDVGCQSLFGILKIHAMPKIMVRSEDKFELSGQPPPPGQSSGSLQST